MEGLVNVCAVVPTHNHKWCVDDAIRTIINQSYPLASLVIVDDGSADCTAEHLIGGWGFQKIKEGLYARRLLQGCDPKYRGHELTICLKVNESPTGPGQARNLGASLSKEFNPHLFAFLDSDDMYAEDKVEKSVEAWQTAPQSIGVIYSDYETVNPDRIHTREYKEPYSQDRLLRECIINCDSLVSAEAFEWAGGFPSIRTCEDYSLWLKLSRKYLAYHIPEALVTIRVGGHSSSATVPSETWQVCYREAFKLAGF